jgi:acetyl esterase/lipase
MELSSSCDTSIPERARVGGGRSELVPILDGDAGEAEMKLDRRVLVLDVLRVRVGRSIANMSLADIQEARAGWMPSWPLLAPVTDRVGFLLFGRPHRAVTTEDRRLPGPAGSLGVRIYRPRRPAHPTPLVVNFHGGGFVLGNLDAGDWLCSMVAGELGAVVASVDYRLAPEHPAPAAVEDCVAATRWLADHGEELAATGPLAVMGDSAGGNLAALVSIAARDAGAPSIAHQVLIYPAVDLTCSFPSIRELGDAPILTGDDIRTFTHHYLGDHIDPADPRVSPWFVEDLSGLPPALILTAEHDPLRDEGRAYADRLRAAGVPTRWTEYAGMPHGFTTLPGVCRSAPQAVAEIVQELRATLLAGEQGTSERGAA